MVYCFHIVWVGLSQPTHTQSFFPIINRHHKIYVQVPHIWIQLTPSSPLCLVLSPYSSASSAKQLKPSLIAKYWVCRGIGGHLRVLAEICGTKRGSGSVPHPNSSSSSLIFLLIEGVLMLAIVLEVLGMNIYSVFPCPPTFSSRFS